MDGNCVRWKIEQKPWEFSEINFSFYCSTDEGCNSTVDRSTQLNNNNKKAHFTTIKLEFLIPNCHRCSIQCAPRVWHICQPKSDISCCFIRSDSRSLSTISAGVALCRVWCGENIEIRSGRDMTMQRLSIHSPNSSFSSFSHKFLNGAQSRVISIPHQILRDRLFKFQLMYDNHNSVKFENS